MFRIVELQKEMEGLQESINRHFNEKTFFKSLISPEVPYVNILEDSQLEDSQLENSKDHLLIEFAVPGIQQEHLSITIENGVLIIAGERNQELPNSFQTIRSERGFGSFRREITLPFRVNPESMDASYRKGILSIRAERMEEDKPRRITIQ